MSDFHVCELVDPVEESDGSAMAGTTPKERPGFSNDMVRSDDRRPLCTRQGGSLEVVTVASFLERIPEARIGKPHDFGP